MIRKTTNELLAMMDEGIISARTVAESCLGFMSEDDVREMAEAYDLLTVFDEDSVFVEDDDTCERDEDAWLEYQEMEDFEQADEYFGGGTEYL